MDTGTHLLLGLSLAGLAQLSPSVASDPTLSAAVLAAALVGSHAPDLDSIIKLKSKNAYLQYHRSWSHSVPAWFAWAGLVGSLAASGWGVGEHTLLLCGCAFIAVMLHVLFDWTNAYGVQMLLPWRREWVHLDALCLTEPAIVVWHAVIGAGWMSGLWSSPGEIYAIGWAATAAYVGWRIAHQRAVMRRLRRRFKRQRGLHVLPGLWWFRWQYIVQTDDGYEMGWIYGNDVRPVRYLPISKPHACIDATCQLSSVQTLHRFAKRKYVSWSQEPDGGFNVTWTDLRFWREQEWPYRVQVRLDSKLNVIDHKIGWYKKAWEYPYV